VGIGSHAEVQRIETGHLPGAQIEEPSDLAHIAAGGIGRLAFALNAVDLLFADPERIEQRAFATPKLLSS
jgi:hypothetical protein